MSLKMHEEEEMLRGDTLIRKVFTFSLLYLSDPSHLFDLERLSTFAFNDNINANTEVHRIMSILQPLLAILPSPEARNLHIPTSTIEKYLNELKLTLLFIPIFSALAERFDLSPS